MPLILISNVNTFNFLLLFSFLDIPTKFRPIRVFSLNFKFPGFLLAVRDSVMPPYLLNFIQFFWMQAKDQINLEIKKRGIDQALVSIFTILKVFVFALINILRILCAIISKILNFLKTVNLKLYSVHVQCTRTG